MSLNEETKLLIKVADKVLTMSDYIDHGTECELNQAMGRLALTEEEAIKILREFIEEYEEE